MRGSFGRVRRRIFPDVTCGAFRRSRLPPSSTLRAPQPWRRSSWAAIFAMDQGDAEREVWRSIVASVACLSVRARSCQFGARAAVSDARGFHGAALSLLVGRCPCGRMTKGLLRPLRLLIAVGWSSLAAHRDCPYPASKRHKPHPRPSWFSHSFLPSGRPATRRTVPSLPAHTTYVEARCSSSSLAQVQRAALFQ